MAPSLTRALVQRHGNGRADTYDAALLDVAQDHLLSFLADEGLFDHGDLIFKGGTSLRKCRLGNAARFSTDLDFAAPNDDVVLNVCDAVAVYRDSTVRDGGVRGGSAHFRQIEANDQRHFS